MASFDVMFDSIKSTISGDEIGRHHHYYHNHAHDPVKISPVDDNVPYNPATFSDICRVRTELSGYDAYLSSEIAKIKSGSIQITVDDSLSHVSTNPVQNRVITDAIMHCVHVDGDETVDGVKTFSDGIFAKNIATSSSETYGASNVANGFGAKAGSRSYRILAIDSIANTMTISGDLSTLKYTFDEMTALSDDMWYSVEVGTSYGRYGKITAVDTVSNKISVTKVLTTLPSGYNGLYIDGHPELGDQETDYGCFATGIECNAIVGNSFAAGFNCRSLAWGSVSVGDNCLSTGERSMSFGTFSHSEDSDAFTWNGDTSAASDVDCYKSNGRGTFNINPIGGVSGFYIGDKNLGEYFKNVVVNADDRLSPSSVNPVQNKILTKTLTDIGEDILALSGGVVELGGQLLELSGDMSSISGGLNIESEERVAIDAVLSGNIESLRNNLDEYLLKNEPAIGLAKGGTTVSISGDNVGVSGELLVDHGIAMTRNGESTNDIVSRGYHFKYMDCTHEAKDGCIDFYLADGLWSYTPLVDLFNEVKLGTKTLEDGGGVFDSTWKCEWEGILDGTKSEFQYRTTGDDTFVNVNPMMFLRNSSNYDICLELVGLVGNKATCRIVKGVQTTMYASIGKFGSVEHAKVLAGQIPPYEGSASAWEHDYVDGINVDDPTDKDRISDIYTLRFTLNNLGGSVIARNQCAFGQANQTTGYATQAFGCENIASGKWGGTFGFGLHQLAWGENVYGRFNRTPTVPRANGVLRYPVIIGCGLTSNSRRDGLKFDREGDAIFDGQTRSKTLSDVGIQSIRKTFSARTAIALFPSEEDAVANTNRITSAIKFVNPTTNDSNEIMVVPTESGGLFWMSSCPLVDSSGSVAGEGATFAVRCKLIPGTGTTKGATWATQDQFDVATFECPVFANGKFYVSGDLGLFWSYDGKTWHQSSIVPKLAKKLEHFHNTSLTHVYHLSYTGGDFFVSSLPSGDYKVTSAYTKNGTYISGLVLRKVLEKYVVMVGGVEHEASFVGGSNWWRKFQDVFMLGNMLSFDPSDDDGWINGQLGDKNTFISPFSSVGAFVPMPMGFGTMAGFRAYCTSSDTGLLYSNVALTDDNKVVLKWEACGGDGQKVKGISCDNLASGIDATGTPVVVCSPMSALTTHPEYSQPLYAKGGESAFHYAAFPASAIGSAFKTAFFTNDGTVVVMCGTDEENGKGFFWTNRLDGNYTKWHKSNIKKHLWMNPTYLTSLDMYTSTAYRQERNILVSRDAKYWVSTDIRANGVPPVEFAGKVIFGGRSGVPNDLSYLTVSDVDETYNLCFGGGVLSDVKQIEGAYTDKIVRAKVNEIIVALGGDIELIPEDFTYDDVRDKVNELIVAYSH